MCSLLGPMKTSYTDDLFHSTEDTFLTEKGKNYRLHGYKTGMQEGILHLGYKNYKENYKENFNVHAFCGATQKPKVLFNCPDYTLRTVWNLDIHLIISVNLYTAVQL